MNRIPQWQKDFDRPASSSVSARWHRDLLPQAVRNKRDGVFAIGDVRSGLIKRVAAAVGEGAQVVAALHGFWPRRGRLQRRPAERAAKEQAVTGDTTGISYKDKDGR